MELKINLTMEEVNAILALMGDTPAKMGYFPLMAKIKAQGDAQIPKEEPAEVAEAA